MESKVQGFLQYQDCNIGRASAVGGLVHPGTMVEDTPENRAKLQEEYRARDLAQKNRNVAYCICGIAEQLIIENNTEVSEALEFAKTFVEACIDFTSKYKLPES